MAWRWAGLPLLCLLFVGCPGKAPDKPDAGTQGARCSADPPACTLPPPPGNEPPNKGGTTTVIAISKLFLGDGGADAGLDPNAWKSYGYNLDGLISKSTDKNHCTPPARSNGWVDKTDGDGGIDNSFGASVVPLLASLGPWPADHSLADGKATVLFRLDNLVDPDKTPDQNGITGAIYEGADKGSPAAFDGSDVWPVAAGSVDGSVDAPKLTFSGSYVAGGVWVSHGKPDVVLPLVTPYYTLLLPIHRAVITMRIHGTGTSATATDGTIAGVLDPEDVVHQAWWEAVKAEPTMCNRSGFASIAPMFVAACDIMSDETNGDPAKTCDAISIGVGFEGHAVTLGAVAPPAAPPSDPCLSGSEAGAPDPGPADAGAD